jgi:hypothetical protein
MEAVVGSSGRGGISIWCVEKKRGEEKIRDVKKEFDVRASSLLTKFFSSMLLIRSPPAAAPTRCRPRASRKLTHLAIRAAAEKVIEKEIKNGGGVGRSGGK